MVSDEPVKVSDESLRRNCELSTPSRVLASDERTPGARSAAVTEPSAIFDEVTAFAASSLFATELDARSADVTVFAAIIDPVTEFACPCWTRPATGTPAEGRRVARRPRVMRVGRGQQLDARVERRVDAAAGGVPHRDLQVSFRAGEARRGERDLHLEHATRDRDVDRGVGGADLVAASRLVEERELQIDGPVEDDARFAKLTLVAESGHREGRSGRTRGGATAAHARTAADSCARRGERMGSSKTWDVWRAQAWKTQVDRQPIRKKHDSLPDRVAGRVTSRRDPPAALLRWRAHSPLPETGDMTHDHVHKHLPALSAALLLASLAFLGGCASDSAAYDTAASVDAAPVIVNANCPIMGSPVDSEVTTASYNGMAVGFCCEGCVGEWDAMSDEAKEEFLAQW